MIPIGTTLQLKSIPRVTTSLIGINTVVFILCSFLPSYDETSMAEYFISLFSVFLHADFSHLFGNMLFLWIFGSYLEDKIGGKRFLLYYYISEIGASLCHLIIDGSPAIGASGAISGVMAIYLYRCHYSKIKTIVPIFFYFIKANINAKWLLIFLFLRDVYDSFYAVDNIAHWAHIGGFLTGIIIGKINNYWTEAKVEHLYERATDSIDKKWGLTEAEDDLLEILKIDPENPEVNLELARYFSAHKEKKDKGKKYYLASARAYYLQNKTKSMAGKVFLEYIEKYREPMEPEIHLNYANTLSNVCDYHGASKILEPIIEIDDLKGTIGERIFINYINFSLKADLKEPAQYTYEKFKKAFPDSLLIKKAESLILSYKPNVKKKIQIERAKSSNGWSGIMDNINDITSDPLFWLILLVSINLVGFFLIVENLIIAFVLTLAARKFSAFFGSIYIGTGSKSEAEGVREFNVSFFMDKATACETEGNFDDAIGYLIAAIEEDKIHERDLEARYKIARLYHKKLNQPANAINEYKTIFKIAPKDHPFKRDAYEGIKELSQPSALNM